MVSTTKGKNFEQFCWRCVQMPLKVDKSSPLEGYVQPKVTNLRILSRLVLTGKSIVQWIMANSLGWTGSFAVDPVAAGIPWYWPAQWLPQSVASIDKRNPIVYPEIHGWLNQLGKSNCVAIKDNEQPARLYTPDLLRSIWC